MKEGVQDTFHPAGIIERNEDEDDRYLQEFEFKSAAQRRKTNADYEGYGQVKERIRPSYMYLKKHPSAKVTRKKGYRFTYDKTQLKNIHNNHRHSHGYVTPANVVKTMDMIQRPIYKQTKFLKRTSKAMKLKMPEWMSRKLSL